MKRASFFLTLALSSFTLLFTACQTAAPTRVDRGATPTAPTQSQWRGAEATPQTAQPSRRVEASPVKSSDVTLRTQQIKVTKTVLQAASVGEDLQYRIRIEALEDVGTVRVTEEIPANVEFRSATPSATLSRGQASWAFPSMRKGTSQNIDVTVRATAEGDHQICSTVTVDNAFCLNFFSGQPKLDVTKEGPATVELGEEVTWVVAVTNSGSAAATNVVVTDTLPDAFTATSDLRQNIGTLNPGETRTVEYSAKAVAQGEFRNRAVASHDGSDADTSVAESSAPISVVQSGLRVRKSGPSEAYVFKPVPFEITIENTGDTTLRNIRITDVLPEGSSVADNGNGRVSGNAIGWMIPEMPAGSSQLIRTEIAATRTGSSTNRVRVVSANGLEASDSVTTEWLAVPGVTISITDSVDPIRVRESTVYTIQVRNQGDFEPVAGTVTVRFTDTIKPTAVSGDAQGTIDGQVVTFPRTTLEPGRDTNLTITAEGAGIGAGRATLSFSADFLEDPIISEEATNVY